MKILITSSSVEGRSTLAAIVAKSLRDYGIPIQLIDFPSEGGDAEHLLSDPERFQRNVMSIAARDKMIGRFTLVTTQLVAPLPGYNIAGDETKHVAKTIAAIQSGDIKQAHTHMRHAFMAYLENVSNVVAYAIGMGMLTPAERVAVAAMYAWTRKALGPDERFKPLPEIS